MGSAPQTRFLVGTRRWSKWLVILLLLAYVTQGVHYIYRTSFVSDQRVFTLWDDGMISMRYAKNLAEGAGLVWNVDGDRVQGFSNLGLTLFMAALHLLPISAEKMPLLV